MAPSSTCQILLGIHSREYYTQNILVLFVVQRTKSHLSSCSLYKWYNRKNLSPLEVARKFTLNLAINMACLAKKTYSFWEAWINFLNWKKNMNLSIRLAFYAGLVSANSRRPFESHNAVVTNIKRMDKARDPRSLKPYVYDLPVRRRVPRHLRRFSRLRGLR